MSTPSSAPRIGDVPASARKAGRLPCGRGHKAFWCTLREAGRGLDGMAIALSLGADGSGRAVMVEGRGEALCGEGLWQALDGDGKGRGITRVPFARALQAVAALAGQGRRELAS